MGWVGIRTFLSKVGGIKLIVYSSQLLKLESFSFLSEHCVVGSWMFSNALWLEWNGTDAGRAGGWCPEVASAPYSFRLSHAT